ncbi:MAG: hypothetical protein JXB13_03895, partial [Phycisphaerae bacterium]|nr:hypothetical protein [Phycisphaerae bacterium]
MKPTTAFFCRYVCLTIGLLAAMPSASVRADSCAPAWTAGMFQPPGTGTTVYALTVFDDDGAGPRPPSLYAGVAESVFKWDGTQWAQLPTFDGTIYALAVFDDDGPGPRPPALYAGGHFWPAGGVPASHIARWDGAQWSALGSGTNGDVRALVTFDDGTGPALYAGGDFTSAGGRTVNRVAKWNGTQWSDLDGGMDNRIHALTVFDDGTGPALYAGGDFTTAGGVPARHIAKWNPGAPGQWLALGDGVSGSPYSNVHALGVLDDGNGSALYVGGSFTVAGGVSASNIAKWDGTYWSALGAGMNLAVCALTAFDDGTGPALYAGGYFTTAGGVTVNSIAKWDGAQWSALGSGTSD